MIYKLKVLKDDKELFYSFNNQTAEVWNETGELLTPFPNSNRGKIDYNPRFTWDSEDNTLKRSINTAEIIVGLKCNHDCEYCSQRQLRDSNEVYSGSPSDVPKFIELLEKANFDIYNHIVLWGGEPLVYWKVLLRLIPELRRLYPNNVISFPTNGTLLDYDKIDFLADYGCRIAVSHDGMPNIYRTSDVLQDPKLVEVFKYACKKLGKKGFGFSTVQSRNNCNVIKSMDWIKSILPDLGFVGCHNVVRCHDDLSSVDKSVYALSEKDKAELQSSICEALNSNKYRNIEDVLPLREDLSLSQLYSAKGLDYVGAECGSPMGHVIHVNLAGDLFRCHSFCAPKDKIGTLQDFIEGKPIYMRGYQSFFNRKLTDCLNCFALVQCRGACPAASDEAHRISCENIKPLQSGILIHAIQATFGVKVLEVIKS